MEVLLLPGQLVACCTDSQRLAYLIYYSTNAYHLNLPSNDKIPRTR